MCSWRGKEDSQKLAFPPFLTDVSDAKSIVDLSGLPRIFNSVQNILEQGWSCSCALGEGLGCGFRREGAVRSWPGMPEPKRDES